MTGSGASADFYPRPPRGGRRRGLQSHSRGRYFYPRPPRGGRPTLSTLKPRARTFLSTPSARRATDFPCGMSSDTADFYPRPPRGGRPPSPSRPLHSPVFLSTPSARRATGASPRRRARRKISIHALREEGDLHPAKGVESHVDFYPRPPRGGRRLGRGVTPPAGGFLSTPSARRATETKHLQELSGAFLSTPSARRATGWGAGLRRLRADFYPRPPRGGRHRAKCTRGQAISYFYPRPPRGGRRRDKAFAGAEWCISIHALREEGDAERSTPRPTRTKFLSTPSARRATNYF